MGGAPSISTLAGTTTARLSLDEKAVQLMLPVYFVRTKVNREYLEYAKRSWEMITDSEPPKFSELKQSPEKFQFENPVEWFHTTFYNRLFDVHPLSRAMFRDPKTQGRFLVALFSFIFTILEDEMAFHTKLLHLAESHCQKGVKAVEYGIIGEVMFWTLRHCLGSAYCSHTHLAWVQIFSAMLAVIVPVAVTHELVSSDAQDARFGDSGKMKSYTYTEGGGDD